MNSVHERICAYGVMNETDLSLLSATGIVNTAQAEGLLDMFGSLRGVERAGITELCQVKGIGPKKAASLRALFEVGRRFIEVPLDRGGTFSSSRDLFLKYNPYFVGVEHEEFWVVLLNQRNEVLKDFCAAKGTVNRCLVDMQGVFAPAMREKAVRMILLHNHPSGDPEPSQDDRAMTRRVQHCAEMMHVEILDHIVIGDNKYVSFADRGWIS